MFLLVPQVNLSKRLEVARAAEHWSAQLPAFDRAAASDPGRWTFITKDRSAPDAVR
jgi:hypothetical protein